MTTVACQALICENNIKGECKAEIIELYSQFGDVSDCLNFKPKEER